MKQELPSEKHQSFDLEFANLLSPNNASGDFFFAFIRRSLKQFHLDKAYTETDIMSEVYWRGVKTLQKGVIIESFLGWIRAVAYNYIRELSRERSKSVQLEEYHLPEQKRANILEQNPIEDENLKLKLELVSIAFKKLNPEQQKLLRYKVIEDLSWRKIQGLGEYQDFTVPALRKRKERILKKLHLLYHSLENSSEEISMGNPHK